MCKCFNGNKNNFIVIVIAIVKIEHIKYININVEIIFCNITIIYMKENERKKYSNESITFIRSVILYFLKI